MSYSVTIETVNGETKVTAASGTVPDRITVNGHVAESDTAKPMIYVNDGQLCASSYGV